MNPLLQVSNIRFNYMDREVLRDVSLSLQAGSCTALAGPNGAGKTTLLRIIAGTLRPASGTVFLEGEPLAALSLKQRSCKIALVPQQLEVPFDFTVQQIVEQGRTPHVSLLRGLSSEDRIAVDQALDLTDAFIFRNRIFNELSGGERQRVKIALGLAQQPKLLLLDEPTQNLDVGRQAELIALLHHLRTQGITIFASIHDLHLVQDNFSAVHLLGEGASVLSGPPAQVLTPENLMSAFNCSLDRHPLLTREPVLRQVI